MYMIKEHGLVKKIRKQKLSCLEEIKSKHINAKYKVFVFKHIYKNTILWLLFFYRK
ncbi:hypothetical protein Hanom_Chr17g01576701 [Helianthus anomalus]